MIPRSFSFHIWEDTHFAKRFPGCHLVSPCGNPGMWAFSSPSARCRLGAREVKSCPRTHVTHFQTPCPCPKQGPDFSGHCISACCVQCSAGTLLPLQHPCWLVFLCSLLSLPAGGRDKRGGPILTFPARSNHDRIRQEDLRKLVTYLASVPR